MSFNLFAVRLFGSQARGESDDESDVDVLAVVAKSNEAIRNEVVRLVREECSGIYPGKFVSVSVYGIERISEHYRSGSLFAWHLYLESRSMSHETGFPGDISFLGVPSRYLGAKKDIAELCLMIDSVIESLSGEACSLVFEAGMLYLAIRNSAIVASESVTKKKRFGRYAAFDVSRSAGMGLFISRECFDVLAQCRSRSVHGLAAPLLGRDALLSLAIEAKRWIANLQERVNDRTD